MDLMEAGGVVGLLLAVTIGLGLVELGVVQEVLVLVLMLEQELMLAKGGVQCQQEVLVVEVLAQVLPRLREWRL
jgi:hypothetical protein